ncbi:MAG: hypothetical protein ACK42E_04230, partial [Candidatus Bipolaricaulaceae bacterium]
LAPPAPVPDLHRDNPLGVRFWQMGYGCYELPRSAATQLDIDTPGELQILALHPGLPERVKEELAGIPTARAQALLEALVDPEAEVVLVGATAFPKELVGVWENKQHGWIFRFEEDGRLSKIR